MEMERYWDSPARRPIRPRQEVLVGEVEVPFEERYQLALSASLSRLGEEDQSLARAVVDTLISKINHPETLTGIKCDLVFRILDRVGGMEDFRVKINGYVDQLKERRYTFDGIPIFKETP
jgi:hypothetical protein